MTLTFKGNPIHLQGELPRVNQPAPDFQATDGNLEDINLSKFSGRKIVLNIFPSLDTSVCASAMQRFNEIAQQFLGIVFLCISADLPFAQARFCAAKELKNVIPLSVFRFPEFGKTYGVTITDGLLRGLLARAVIAIDQKGNIFYKELVKEVGDEPNYSGLISAIQKAMA